MQVLVPCNQGMQRSTVLNVESSINTEIPHIWANHTPNQAEA